MNCGPRTTLSQAVAQPATAGRPAAPRAQCTHPAATAARCKQHPDEQQAAAPPPPALPPLLRRAAAGAAAALLAAQAVLLPFLPEAAAALPPLPTRFPPLPALELPKYEQAVLPNGLRVFLLEDHELPVVQGTLLMRGGQRASPEDKVGLATLSGAVQRSGGSVAHPGRALDEALEERAASIEGGAGGEAFAFGFSCLSEDVGEVLGLFAEVARQPALPQDKLDLAKTQILSALEHRNDNPSAVPGRELAKLIYGKGSVFARDPTPEQIQSITVADIRSFLASWQRPDSAVLGLVGDFKASDAQQLVEAAFGDWAPAPGAPAAPLPLPNTPLPDQGPIAGRIFLIDFPGAAQASVAVGEPGVSMRDPDESSLEVLNQLFNGFGGRLFNQIRSRDGLAYSVSGGWSSLPIDHPGLFVASAETAQPAALLAALRAALEDAGAAPPPADELASAKQETLNQFVFNFASRPAQLARIATFDLLGIPQDYLFKYRAGVDKVRPADVQAAAQRRLHPAQQTVVVAGDAARLRPELEALGMPIEALTLEP